MAPNTREMIGTIAGPFKIVERTNQKDSSKRILYRAECVCSAIELGPLSALGKFQGYGCSCPGHPLKKGMEKPESGFTFFPDQPEYDTALAAWEAALHPDQLKEECEDDRTAEMLTYEITPTPEVAPTTEIVTATETANAESAPINVAEEVVTTSEVTSTTEPEAAIIIETSSTTEVVADAPTADNTTADATTDVIAEAPAVTQETPKAAVDRNTSTKMSAVLATRLKLTNYHTTSKKLTPPVPILGQDATSVVFAEDATGTDRVMLHICLCSVDGKTKSIVSSMKKVPTDDFSTLTHTLAAMQITWRSKDQPPIAVAK